LAGRRLTGRDRLAIASYMVFAASASLFPFLIFLAALASFLGTAETADEVVDGMFLFLPDDVAGTLVARYVKVDQDQAHRPASAARVAALAAEVVGSRQPGRRRYLVRRH
jgi:uncharacterized BrkB/YihY/UPF0761 family membrane protein